MPIRRSTAMAGCSGPVAASKIDVDSSSGCISKSSLFLARSLSLVCALSIYSLFFQPYLLSARKEMLCCMPKKLSAHTDTVRVYTCNACEPQCASVSACRCDGLNSWRHGKQLMAPSTQWTTGGHRIVERFHSAQRASQLECYKNNKHLQSSNIKN